MDKKNFTIGAVLLIAAFAIIYFGPKSAPPPPRPAPTAVEQGATTGPASTATPATTATASSPQAATPGGPDQTNFAAVNRDAADATVTTLANEFIEARFTDSGGALRDVAFISRDGKGRLVYPEKLHGNDPFVFNSISADPILAFVDYPGLDRNTRFQRVAQSATHVVYRAVIDNRLEVTRTYTLTPQKSETADPYQIRHETTFRNLSDQPVQPAAVKFSLGTAAPTHAKDDGLQLTTGYNTGSDREFIPRSELESSGGFLGLGAHAAKPYISTPGPLVWTAVKNQFFTSILTGDQPATAMVSRRVKLVPALTDDDIRAYGVTGIAQFDVKPLAPKTESKVSGTIYVGPKEYHRLANGKIFKADEDKVMDFGFFKFFSQILLTLMTWIHSFTNNWGVAIVLTTLALKILFIPFTLAASKSAKRMAKIQPEMQAIREKYKDNPQKQQQATMELF